jgi:thiamine-phosphate pyrophosphorylase
MAHRALDYSLYLVTDRGLSLGRSTLEVVRAAVRGGVTCVQLREKACSTREYIDAARRPWG